MIMPLKSVSNFTSSHLSLAIHVPFSRFPEYPAEPLVNSAPRLDLEGLELLGQLLQFEGRRRVPARAAMRHAYFASFPQAIYDLPDGEDSFFLLSFFPQSGAVGCSNVPKG